MRSRGHGVSLRSRGGLPSVGGMHLHSAMHGRGLPGVIVRGDHLVTGLFYLHQFTICTKFVLTSLVQYAICDKWKNKSELQEF